MGNKKIFPLSLFLQLLRNNPVCLAYSVGTAVVCIVPAIIFYSLWINLKEEKKFWLWRLKKEEKKKNVLNLPKEAYVTIFEEIEKQILEKEKR